MGIVPWWEEKYKNPYDYEKKTADKLNKGRRSIASGAIFGDMDVKSPDTLIDCKRVARGHTYRIDKRDFDKVKAKANLDQIPAMLINFHEYSESLAVIREKDFIALINSLDKSEE